MEFLTIKDVAEKAKLPKPTVYRMFHEMGDLIPHKRVGRKILFPEEAVTKIVEIRKLTKEEGLTYKMIRDEALISLRADEEVKGGVENGVTAQLAPRLSEILSRSVAAGFEGLREDLRLLAAQIDRQNDLLARYLGQKQALDDFSPSVLEEEFKEQRGETEMHNDEEEAGWTEQEDGTGYVEQKTSNFRAKWSNFWAGKGWRV